MKRHANVLWFILVASLLPTLAQAGGATRMGPYVGLNGAYGINLFKDEVKKIVPGATIDDTGGLNARIGLRFLSALAVEAEYEWMKGFEVTSPVNGGFDIESHALTGNLRLMMPIWRVQPYLLAGLGVAWYNLEGTGLLSGADLSRRAFAGRVGGGVDLYLSDNWVVNGEVSALLTNADFDIPAATTLDALHYISISAGLQYRF